SDPSRRAALSIVPFAAVNLPRCEFTQPQHPSLRLFPDRPFKHFDRCEV
ncbi:MAG: hypothetical protein ACI8W3_002046, partial [Myxococcota bacterium]